MAHTFSKAMKSFVCALLLTVSYLLEALPATAAPKSWQTLTNCTLIANSNNDGDSFHVRAAGKEYIFRLYFVDAPETDDRFPERVAAQAAYFGVSPAQALQIGHDAATFTKDQLAKPFSITTRWQDAAGSSSLRRQYGLVSVTAGDLGEMLVSNGLARIHGADVGGIGKERVERLRQLEEQAKARKSGAWRFEAKP